MESWEKQLKDDMNQPLPAMIDQRVEETLKQLPRKKAKRNILFGLSAAVAVLTLTFGLSLISPTFANTMKEIPVIGSAFEFAGNIGVKKGKEEGLALELGEQIEIDGQLITFTDTLYDGGEIHIGYTIQVKEKKQQPQFTSNIQFLIDGRSLDSYGMGVDESEVENGLYAGTMSIRVREELPDSFTLSIHSFEGNEWLVDLPVTKKGNHRAVPINQTKKQGDFTILYDHITFFPTSTELSLRLMMDEELFEANRNVFLDYRVIDDKGRALQLLSGSGGGDSAENGKILASYKYHFEPLQTIPNSITIKPIAYGNNKDPLILDKEKWEGKKTRLSQGAIGNLTVLSATEENGVTTFTYEVEGEDLYRQAIAFWLEDAAGIRYNPDGPEVRVDGTVNQYQKSFSKTPPSDELYITTVSMDVPNYLEDLEVTIDLKE